MEYKDFLEQLGQVAATGDQQAVMRFMYANPDYLQLLQEEQAKKEKGAKLASNASTTIDLLKNLGFTLAAVNQISVAAKEAGGLVKPSLPTVPGRDPMLAQALYNAQRGIADPSKTLAPAKQEIQDAYNATLQQAQQASGGQAGTYQSMAQAANTARMRAALGLAPLAQQTQLQNQDIYNQLLAQRLQENQNMFTNRFGVQQAALDQYNLEAQAAGAAGAAGRENLYKSIGAAADTLSDNPYYLPFDKGIKNYMMDVKRRNQANTQAAIQPPIGYMNDYSGNWSPQSNINPVGPYTASTRGFTPNSFENYA
jgi:hypothetical protein